MALKMAIHPLISTIFLAGVLCSSNGYGHAQDAPPTGMQDTKKVSGVNIHRDGWDRVVPAASANPSSEPTPIRDLSGIWEPTPGFRDGVFSQGSREYAADGKPEHELPFTPLGLQTWKEHSPDKGL